MGAGAVSVVRTRHGGQVEVRLFEGSSFIPSRMSGSPAGVPVTRETASGLPAVGRAIRLVGGLIGTTSICVYQGRQGNKVEKDTTPQAQLLNNPYPGVSVFQWRYDIAVSLEASENAFIRKIKTGRGALVALEVLQPRYVDAWLDRNGDKQFRISTASGWKPIPSDEILHIRGHTVDGGPFGVSRITQHCDPIGSMLAAQRFEGAYFRNSARPDVAVIFPQGITQEQGNVWADNWNQKLQGVDNKGKAMPMGGGATIQVIPVSMQDAQFIESRQFSVSELARIMDVEAELLGAEETGKTTDMAMDRFLAFQMPPRLARITDGLHADPDLFPEKALYPESASNPLMFASPSTRADVQHKEIQAGTLLPDEARADNGRPPLPDGLGKIPQVTPVGGAPNPTPLPAATGPKE